jgi:hypothetical protein
VGTVIGVFVSTMSLKLFSIVVVFVVAPSRATEAISYIKSLHSKVRDLLLLTDGNRSHDDRRDNQNSGKKFVVIPPNLMSVDGYKWPILNFISIYAKKGVSFSVAKNGAGLFQ